MADCGAGENAPHIGSSNATVAARDAECVAIGGDEVPRIHEAPAGIGSCRLAHICYSEVNLCGLPSSADEFDARRLLLRYLAVTGCILCCASRLPAHKEGYDASNHGCPTGSRCRRLAAEMHACYIASTVALPRCSGRHLLRSHPWELCTYTVPCTCFGCAGSWTRRCRRGRRARCGAA